MITDTTLESFKKLRDEGRITTQEEEIIYQLHYRGYLTDCQLSQYIGLPPGRISARRRGLVKKGKIEEKGKIHDNVTNRTVTLWGLK